MPAGFEYLVVAGDSGILQGLVVEFAAGDEPFVVQGVDDESWRDVFSDVQFRGDAILFFVVEVGRVNEDAEVRSAT